MEGNKENIRKDIETELCQFKQECQLLTAPAPPPLRQQKDSNGKFIPAAFPQPSEDSAQSLQNETLSSNVFDNLQICLSVCLGICINNKCLIRPSSVKLIGLSIYKYVCIFGSAPGAK